MRPRAASARCRSAANWLCKSAMRRFASRSRRWSSFGAEAEAEAEPRRREAEPRRAAEPAAPAEAPTSSSRAAAALAEADPSASRVMGGRDAGRALTVTPGAGVKVTVTTLLLLLRVRASTVRRGGKGGSGKRSLAEAPELPTLIFAMRPLSGSGMRATGVSTRS